MQHRRCPQFLHPKPPLTSHVQPTHSSRLYQRKRSPYLRRVGENSIPTKTSLEATGRIGNDWQWTTMVFGGTTPLFHPSPSSPPEFHIITGASASSNFCQMIPVQEHHAVIRKGIQQGFTPKQGSSTDSRACPFEAGHLANCERNREFRWLSWL